MISEFITKTLRMENYLLPWSWHTFSILFDTGWGIGTKTCKLDNVFSADAIWFGSDINIVLSSIYSFNGVNLIFDDICWIFQHNLQMCSQWDYQCHSKCLSVQILFYMVTVSIFAVFLPIQPWMSNCCHDSLSIHALWSLFLIGVTLLTAKV